MFKGSWYYALLILIYLGVRILFLAILAATFLDGFFTFSSLLTYDLKLLISPIRLERRLLT